MAVAILQVFPFTVTFGASTSATYTIGSGSEAALTDVTKSFLVFGVEAAGADSSNSQIRGVITDTTTLTFTRFGSTGTPVIRGYVVEGSTGITVDHGTMSGFTDGSENTAALSNVTDLTKAFLLTSGDNGASATSTASTWSARLFDSSGLKVGISSGTDGGTGEMDTISYQAVQMDNISVQRGTLSDLVLTTGTTVTQAISEVTLAKSFVQGWYRGDDGSSLEGGDMGVQVKFDSTTQISATRHDASEAPLTGGRYEVVSFTDNSTVQEIIESLSSTTASGTNAITTLSASAANAFAIGSYMGCGGRSDDSTGDNYDWIGTCEITSTTNATVRRGQTQGAYTGTWYIVDLIPSSAPAATVPSSGKCINTYAETAVPGISVTAGTSDITAVATTCTTGCTLTYDTTGTSVTVTGNGTNAATLSNGASEAEWTTVLDTLTMRGTIADTTITVTIVPTDGTLNDSEQFTVICDPASVTVTGTNANVIARLADMKIRLLSGQTNDTITITVTDDGSSPLTAESSFIIGLSSYFSTGNLLNLIRLLRRRRKKKSGN